MNFRFNWDAENRKHLAANHPDVKEAEVEEVMNGEYIVMAAGATTTFDSSGEEPVEQRYECVGRTRAGRLLVVVLTWREDSIRPITAYPAEGWRARTYRQEKKGDL